MAALGRGDAERLLRFVATADEIAQDEPFTPETLVELGRLVEADCIQYSELDRVRRVARLGVVRDPDEDEGEWTPEMDAAWWDVITYEHPVCVRHQRGDFGAMKLSDFLTPRELRRTRMYALAYEPWGFEHTMSVGIPSPLWHTKTFLFDRRRHDFRERDRLVLDLLQPHLGRIWNTVRVRRLLVAALATLDESPRANPRGAVLLGPGRTVEYSTPSAARLLGEFFPERGAGLPPLVVGWLEEGARAPFTVRAGRRSLTVARSGDALLLTESVSLGLTPREQQILMWVARGKTNAEIAEGLWLSPGTVRKHLENAFAKLGVRTRTAAAARFLALVDGVDDRPLREAQSS